MMMSDFKQEIPSIPSRPRVKPLGGNVQRSYPTGKVDYSRSLVGQEMVLVLTLDMQAPFRTTIQARMVTNLNTQAGKTREEIPFQWVDSRTLICRVKTNYPGLYCFRAEFSLDHGTSWMRDDAEDAWVMVDPVQVDGLRLYTLIPNVSGTLTDWAQDLPRIQSMGFNAVHLLPLTTLDTSESPYSAKDLFHIDPRYTDPLSPLSDLEQLEQFVQTARELGVKLCFDLVLNHVGVNSFIAKQAPDWIIPDPVQSDGLQRARYLSDHGWFSWDDLVLVNYDHPSLCVRTEIWDYMTAYMLFWARYAHITGGFVRFDNLHSSNQLFIKTLTEKLHEVYPQVAILAEYFTDEATQVRTNQEWGLNLNLATPWDYKFVPKLREYLKYIQRLSTHLRFFMPVSSHDSGTPAQEFCSVEATRPRYVAAALLGTGATGIVQGVEFGVNKKIDFIGKPQRIHFPETAPMGEFIRKVNQLLADYPIFRQGANCQFVDCGHDAIIAAFRQDRGSSGSGVLVACNFDIGAPQSIEINLSSYLGIRRPLDGYELLSDHAIQFPGSILKLRLTPCEVMVIRF